MHPVASFALLAIAFLGVVGTVGLRPLNWHSFAFWSATASKSKSNTATTAPWNSQPPEWEDNAELKPFRQKDTEYRFIYNVQIVSGLQTMDGGGQNAAEDPPSQQKALMRIQCRVNIQFASDERHAQLQLDRCRVGQHNGKMLQRLPQEMQPIGTFEEMNIPEQTKLQLLTPCQFSYADGVIERVECMQQSAEEWATNFKKAVLNIIQMNLLKQNTAEPQGKQKNDAQEDAERRQDKSFKSTEITLEGVCQTMYTINKAAQFGQQQAYNVTKTINFKQCQRIADVANSFQTDPAQMQCTQCATGAGGTDQQHLCAKCDPKEVKEDELDRSTVIHCQIIGEPIEQYALRNCELRSQYVYRTGTNGAAMQTVVLAKLDALDAREWHNKPQRMPTMNPTEQKESTLMYSNGKAMDEKHFFMDGDEKFGMDGKGSSPFDRVPKVQQAKQALFKLEQCMEDNHKGIDQQAPIQQQRLVEMLRMCTQHELKQLEQQQCAATKAAAPAQQKCRQLMAQALAQCGTRNCVAELAKKIDTKQIAKPIAMQALLVLNQMPAPSVAILDEVQKLCQSETVMSSPMMKQICWLAFGALVNELCQHTTAQNAQECVGNNVADCAQSDFFKKGQCSRNKKETYREAMLSVYQDNQQQLGGRGSGSIYAKVVALGALGNAGLDIALDDLAQIIRDPHEPRIVRVMAIDATRRLRMRMPRRVREVLLPLFMNTREQSHVRITAFANILGTQPTAEVIDQLMYAIGEEPDKEVRSYCYRAMRTMANADKPTEKQIAKHIKVALKGANVDEQQLRTSGKWQFGRLYSIGQGVGGLLLSFAHTVSARSALPAYAHVQLDARVNDQQPSAGHSTLNVYMAQQEAEQWYDDDDDDWATNAATNANKRKPQQRQQWQPYSKHPMMREVNEQDDDSDTYQQQQQQYSNNNNNTMRPFAMVGFRVNNVDKALIALDEPIIGVQMRRNWAAFLLGHFQQQQKLMSMAIMRNINEREAKIATSVGLPLRIMNTVPMLANIEGRLLTATKGNDSDSETTAAPFPFSVKLHLNNVAARMAQIQKMELLTPFMATGVECIRSVHVNLPLQGKLDIDTEQGINMKTALPQQRTQLASVQSLPFTFVATVDPISNLVHEPRHIRTVHNPKLEQQQREVNAVLGQQTLALPLHIRGNYHVPSMSTNNNNLLQQFAQLLQTTENAVKVEYEPNEGSPREFSVRLNGETFSNAAHIVQPDQAKLGTFFAQPFHSVYKSCDKRSNNDSDNYCDDGLDQQQQQAAKQEEEETKQYTNRQKQLNSFIAAYKPSEQYVHTLGLSAQTNGGGSREAKAHCDIRAQCDARMRFCAVQATANANQQWTLSAQAHILTPDTVPSSVEQLQQKQKEQQKLEQFITMANLHWGPPGETKQRVNIRVLGTQTHTAQTRALVAQLRKQGKHLVNAQQLHAIHRRSAFLNNFRVEATYALKAQAQSVVKRAIDLFSSAYFWNTKSQLLSGPSAPKNGQIATTISIDPLKPSNANVTIRTPVQQLRMQHIQLPVQLRLFPLIRSHNELTRHNSLAQMFFPQFSHKSRAQCIVDGQTVDTFDGFAFTAPLSSKCQFVLAKDCGSVQPQFVVLMKKEEDNKGTNAKKSAQKADKVLKVITPDQHIECRPKKTNGKGRRLISCKVNGQPTTAAYDEQCQNTQQQPQQKCVVQYNDPRQRGVTIRTDGVAVQFNGRKAWLTVSQAYKGAQCGLCGHYDDVDEQAQELRMPNGQIASNLALFHRSYALQDGEQCTEQALDAFYEHNEQQPQKDEDEERKREEESDTFNFSQQQQYNQLDNIDDDKDNDDSKQYTKDDYNNNNKNNDSSNEQGEEEGEGEEEWENEQLDEQQIEEELFEMDDVEEEEKEDIANASSGINDDDVQDEEKGKEEDGKKKQCCCCCDSTWDEEGDDEQKCGGSNCRQDEQCQRKCEQHQCEQWQQMSGAWEAVPPTWTTKVREEDNALCFSAQPIKQCPRGTRASYAFTSGGKGKSRRVDFVCMDRAEPEARRLLRQLRWGQRRLKVGGGISSFTETVDKEPQQCWRPGRI